MDEQRYVIRTSLSHRRTLGQFFTPYSIAKLMASWITKDNPKRILDPAFGLGVFFRAIVELMPHQEFHFTGFEIDAGILEYLSLSDPRLIILNEDYLSSPLDYYDAIICNPPYMRFQHFVRRHDVLPVLRQQLKSDLIGYSNLASIFLLKALHELKPSGRLAFIMPYEFFNTGYGVEIKRILVENYLLKQIILFSNEKQIFPEVTTTISILLCRNDKVPSPVKITHIHDQEEVRKIDHVWKYFQSAIKVDDLHPSQKWTFLIESATSSPAAIPEDFVPLSSYGRVMRGIATGANKFFALSKSQIARWGISEENLSRCITKSSQIRKALFTDEDFDILASQDKAVFCLDVKDPNDVGTRRYIRYGEQKGFDKRYLPSKRKPWYKIEQRSPAPILFGVFNRGRVKVIRNFTSTFHFTCYHGFYPNLWGKSLVDRLMIYFISDTGQSVLQQNKRTYGLGLYKFEPGDLNEVMCPAKERLLLISNQEIREFYVLLHDNFEEAIKFSSSLIQKVTGPALHSVDVATSR